MTTCPIFTPIEELVKRVQDNCPIFEKRVFESSSYDEAFASKVQRPVAFVQFISMQNTDGDYNTPSDASFYMHAVQNYGILVLTKNKIVGMRGKFAQRQLIGAFEELAQTFTNWSADNEQRYRLAVWEAQTLPNQSDGEKTAGLFVVRMPLIIFDKDGIPTSDAADNWRFRAYTENPAPEEPHAEGGRDGIPAEGGVDFGEPPMTEESN